MTEAEEMGRELRVTELKPGTIVVLKCLEGPGHAAITSWVDKVYDDTVIFWMGKLSMYLVLRRVGPEREQITDDAGRLLRVYEYLGEP